MNARNQPSSNKSKQNRSKPSGSAPSVSANTQSVDTLNTGLESMGLESIGVHSAAPSELDEARNRKQAAPSPAKPPKMESDEKQLAQYSRPSNASGPPKPKQYQIQAEQSRSQQIARTKQQPANRQAPWANRPPQQRQIQAQQTQNSLSARTKQQQPQNARARTGQQHLQNAQTDRPAPSRPNIPQQQQIAFAPQQPPTYEEITRDLIGGSAFDGNSVAESSAVESAIVPRVGGAHDAPSELDSSMGGSSIDVRGARRAYAEPSELDFSENDSSIVPFQGARGAYDGDSVAAGSIVSRDSTYVSKSTFVPAKLNRGGARSAYDGGVDMDSVTAGSIVSRDSTYVSKATFVPAKLTNVGKPSHQVQPESRPKKQAASSVDPRGVNKWGYF